MLAVILATLKKEVREVLRDKRTLLLTVLVPLGFYPAVNLMTQDLERKQSAKMVERVLRIGVSGWGDDAALAAYNKADDKKVWIPAQVDERQRMLESGEVDLFIEAVKEDYKGYEQRALQLHFYSTASGVMALQSVKEFLDRMRVEEVGRRMKGQEYLLAPIAIVGVVNHASALEVSGSKYGGMGAYFVVFLAFTGCMAVAVDTAAGEKERGTLEAVLVTPASFMGVAFGKLLFIIIMGWISVLSTIGGILIMVVGSGGDSGFTLSDVGVFSLLGILVLLVALVLFFASLLFAFSLLSKSNKEAHVRSSMLMIVVAMSLVYCVIPGVELTRGILWVPVLNAAMSIKVLWSGVMSVGDYFQVLALLVILSGLVLVWISRRVNRDREGVLLK